MKVKITVLAILAIIGLAVIPAKAQSVSTNQSIALDLFMQTNLTFAVAPRYAPHLRNADGQLDHWGVSGAALYPVLNTTSVGQGLAGYRVDYIGSKFSASTISATWSVPFVLWNTYHFQPFAIVGGMIEMTGGNSGNLGVIAGGGVNAKVVAWSWGSLNVGAEYENWSLFNYTPVYGGFVALQVNDIGSLLKKL